MNFQQIYEVIPKFLSFISKTQIINIDKKIISFYLISKEKQTQSYILNKYYYFTKKNIYILTKDGKQKAIVWIWNKKHWQNITVQWSAYYFVLISFDRVWTFNSNSKKKILRLYIIIFFCWIYIASYIMIIILYIIIYLIIDLIISFFHFFQKKNNPFFHF